MITIDELELAKILKRRMSEKDFFEIMDHLHDNYSSDEGSIPIEWITRYIEWHDPVCQANVLNMIDAYKSRK